MKGIKALFVLIVAGAVLAAVAWSSSSKTHAINPIPAFSASDLTAEPGDNWVTARGV